MDELPQDESREVEFDAIEYLNNEGWQRVELGLDRTRELMFRLGDPQESFQSIHVAGTNGKGSVSAFIERTLREAGLKPGLFTSPALYTFEERICVDGVPIATEELYAATIAVRQAAEAMVAEGWEHPTGFELMFAVAAVHFKTCGCRLVVLEVGLGGRLDATNVIRHPEVCVITPISLDHTETLGSTIAEIAGEKAAIIKAGASVVSAAQDPDAMAVICRAAEAVGDSLDIVEKTAITGSVLRINEGKRHFSYQGKPYETTLLGSYQPENAALAIEACRALAKRGWPISEALIEQGIADAYWPGRFEIVATKPLVIVDGSHNPAGAQSLRRSLDDLLEATRKGALTAQVVFVLGVLADKDVEGIVSPLLSLARAIYTFAPPSYRALSARDFAATIERVLAEPDNDSLRPRIEAAESAAEALAAARSDAGENGIVVCAGSLYSLGEIREALL